MTAAISFSTTTDDHPAIQDFLANASPEQHARLNHFARTHADATNGFRAAKQERRAVMRERLGEIETEIGRIREDEERLGPAYKIEKDEKGNPQKIAIDRIGPLKRQSELAKAELAEIDRQHAPQVPGFDSIRALIIKKSKTLVPATLPEISETPTQKAFAAAQKGTDKCIAELLALRDAPRTSEEAIAGIERDVRALAKSGAPRISPLFLGGSFAEMSGKWRPEVPFAGIDWPKSAVEQERENIRHPGHGIVPHTLALFCWLHEDAIIEKLTDAARQMANDDAAVPLADKIAQLPAANEAVVEALRFEVEVALSLEMRTKNLMRWRPRIHPTILGGFVVNDAEVVEHLLSV